MIYNAVKTFLESNTNSLENTAFNCLIKKDKNDNLTILTEENYSLNCIFPSTITKETYLNKACLIKNSFLDLMIYQRLDNRILYKIVLIILDISLISDDSLDAGRNPIDMNENWEIKEIIDKRYLNYLIKNKMNIESKELNCTCFKESSQLNLGCQGVTPVITNNESVCFENNNGVVNKLSLKMKDCFNDGSIDWIKWKELFYTHPSQSDKKAHDFSDYEKVNITRKPERKDISNNQEKEENKEDEVNGDGVNNIKEKRENYNKWGIDRDDEIPKEWLDWIKSLEGRKFTYRDFERYKQMK